MEQVLRQTWAFFFRDYHLTRRYMSWVIVFTFYAIVNSATIALIGVAAGDRRLTLVLIVGVLLWNFLSTLFSEIANSITYERWEGTLEYTFMAPVSRFVHLAGVSLFTMCYSVVRTIIIVAGLWLFIDLDLSHANLPGIVVVLVVSSMAFVGLGLMAAVLPVFSPERGAEATNIFQGILLLVSGVYFPVEVLPGWLQPLAAISPATYALSASRKLIGIEDDASAGGAGGSELLAGAPLSAVVPE
ncbi:MAG TPA: ABC transporter permease, partial [Pyrinomonadaceae bacterium]|nr:ABC transporter permease [Pyrinomonadaceae bacterium]